MSDLQDLENELANEVETESPKEGLQNPNPAQPFVKSRDPDFSTPSDDGPDSSGDSALSEDFDNLAIEIAKLKDALARSQADYKNLVTRTERERLEMGEYVTEKLVVKLLPSFDNLERLLSGTPEAERTGVLYEGVKSTFAGLVRALESVGVSSFESAGQPLDPAFHEAVAQVPGAEGTVVVEFEKGYKLREKVIRHAKVTVGNGAEA